MIIIMILRNNDNMLTRRRCSAAWTSTPASSRSRCASRSGLGIYIYIYISWYLHIYIYIYVYVYVYVHVYVCVCIDVCIYIYMCIHTYIHHYVEREYQSQGLLHLVDTCKQASVLRHTEPTHLRWFDRIRYSVRIPHMFCLIISHNAY